MLGLRPVLIWYRLFDFVVRIPPSPQDQTKQEDVERHLLAFYTYGSSLLDAVGMENKKGATK